ncbi:MAG: P1 family peptidase, partial [Clostridiales bacterium]
MYQGAITDIKGIKVGCADNAKAITGCTAVLFEQLTTAGVDVRGGGP